jgi:hypothetical protein
MAKKLTISHSLKPVLVISRQAFKAEKLVYIAVANKPLNYEHGKSCVAYIGTSKNGASRMAESAAERARDLCRLHGVSSLSLYVVTCSARQRLRSWRKLESALILAFKHRYGTVPICNKSGARQKWSDELEYFTRSRLEKVLDKHEMRRCPESKSK